MSLPESMERGLNLISIYTSCAYLFRSLCDPANLHISQLIRNLTAIRPSHSVRDVLGVLAKLSHDLQEMEPEHAASTVKPLNSKAIFPVSDTMETLSRGIFYRMVSANNPHWYIDDTNEFRLCFGGKLSLFAGSPVFVPQLENLLTALDLDSRKLSEVAIRGSNPIGRQRFLAETTGFLRSRYPFLKS